MNSLFQDAEKDPWVHKPLGELREVETDARFAKLRADLTTELAKVRSEIASVKPCVYEMRVDLLKWMLIFSVFTQLLVIVAIVVALR